jgi:phosphoglycerate dehydrogenase-like enzyme
MKIAIDMPAFEPGLNALKSLGGIAVELLPEQRPLSGPVLEATRVVDARIADANVLFCTHPPRDLDAMTALQWVQISSTGYSQLFRHRLPERGIRATNSRGCFDVPIAEWNVAMMVNLARDLRQMIRNQDAAVWSSTAVFQREIRGLTVGLWGYGGIARETARLSRQLGLRVHVLTRRGVGPRHATYVVPGTGDPEGILPHRVFTAGQELEFLAGLDFLIVGLPLTAATDGLIGERELRALRRTAFVLNPARGPIIAEAALLRALDEGWIAGAALDTHYKYPLPPEHPLWKKPNVILTPHISGSFLSPHFGERLWDLFIQNVGRFSRGEELLNELSPAELSGK